MADEKQISMTGRRPPADDKKSRIKFLRGQRQSVSSCQPETNLTPVTGAPVTETLETTEEKNDWTFLETKELSDYRHYMICKNYLREYERSGYGKGNPGYEQKLRLAAAAADVEISTAGGEAVLPLLEGLTRTLEKAEGYIENLDARKLNDPIVYALTERDGKKLAAEAGKQAADAAAVYRDLADALQQMRIVRKMQHDYKKEGKRADFPELNEKISVTYSHALGYVQKYEERELRRSIEKSGFNPTEISAAVMALANGGGDETTG